MKKTTIIIIGLAVLAAAGMVVFSLITTRMPEEERLEKNIPPKPIPAEIPRPPARELIPQRPQDYGMVVIEGADTVPAQQKWDVLIKDKIRGLKTQYSPDDWDKIREKIKEDPAVTAKKIADIDADIKKCRQILEKEPDNTEIKQKLERLMMLRSIGEELP